MIDIKAFRDNPDLIRRSQEKRGEDPKIVDAVVKLDIDWRDNLRVVDQLKHQRNLVTARIAELKKSGKDAGEEIKQMRELNKKITEIDSKQKGILFQRDELRMEIPNILDRSVPDGNSEKQNKVLMRWGKIKKTAKSHIDLGKELDLFDTERAAKASGSRFYYLKGELVRLNLALVAFALDFLAKKGFRPVQPPFMLNRAAMAGAVPLSVFEEMIYKIQDEDLYLIGTAEHALVAYHRDETLDPKELPIRFAGVSSCFRKEAGAHGKDTKGIFRVHQFEKVEQFVFCRPEDSWKEFEKIRKNTEELYKKLELPFRFVTLCAGETGRAAARTDDIEVWMPAQKAYRELGSCSNVLDYQAIRSNIRFRHKDETRYPHMLNNTAIATERTMVAILENHQQRNGSIRIPKALWPYTGFKKIAAQAKRRDKRKSR
jgi:seryl-tRNA synthetase